MTRSPAFRSFFMGGFECSTYKRADGIRLDLVALTGHDIGPVRFGEFIFKPLREQLAWVYERYRRLLLIAETGTEGVFRAPWLHYIADEVAIAKATGIPIEGICLYPVLSHCGWDDRGHRPNGLFDGYTPDADRTAYGPLADELARQQDLFARGVLARG